ncbi:MAG: hypothetical protein JW862_02420 [Anaerolineales bacterium]|nr:hypothetical protein [Anaerolineales bacterium]
MGLIARGLELNGIATTLTSWSAGITRRLLPPRATYTRLARGATLGQPGDWAQQKRVLAATLALLSQAAPLEPLRLDERAP